MSFLKYGLMGCGLLLLSGCQTREKPLYAWYNFQPELYAYMQGEDAQRQLTTLEADEQKAQAKGLALPPGFHSHLGLLYAKLGQTSQAQTEFQQEKTLFPESAPYMDFILKNMGKPVSGTSDVPALSSTGSPAASPSGQSSSPLSGAPSQTPSQAKSPAS